MAETRQEDKDPRNPQPTQPVYDPRNPQGPRPPQPTQFPANDPRNPQGQPERSQTDISREAKPGTPASRDAAAARSGKITGLQAGAGAQSTEPPPEPLPIFAPSSAAIIRTSTTAAPRPPEGPLLVTLYSVADPNNIIQVMPIDAEDHIASGEWTLSPAGETAPTDPPITRSTPNNPQGRS